jgi:Na+/phosphate symporter
MIKEAALREKFSPVFDKLGAMVVAARDAFNRHSQTSLEHLKKLYDDLNSDLNGLLNEINDLLAKAPEAQRTSLLRLQSLVTRLQVVGETLMALSSPISQKIKGGVLFSDKAVSQVNMLFDHQAGLLRSVMDVLKTDNAFLKRYIQEEGRKLVQSCNDFATEHEARLIEGVCLPQAAPLFLAILDQMRTAGQHVVNLGQILSQD